jgi:hypothetical protein
MKLTKENIQFIDNYLKNSEVIYYDIRMEMLDHVATAVEQKMEVENLDFYYAFKNYMVINKSELLKLNKEEGLHFIEPLKKFGHFIIQPIQIFLTLIVSFAVYIFAIKFGIKNSSNYFLFSVLISYILFGVGHLLINRSKKFYYIDKNFSILFILHQIGNLFYRSAKESITLSIIFNSIILFVFIAFFKFYYSEMKSFKKRNQYLFQ